MAELGFNLRQPGSRAYPPAHFGMLPPHKGMKENEFGTGSVEGPLLLSGDTTGLRVLERELEVTEYGRREAKK